MSSPFRGYLIKAVRTGEILSSKYIVYGTFKSTPNQREELKAYRDDNSRNLTRVTADGEKSTFSCKTKKNLHLQEKMELQSFFTRAEETALDHKQRRVQLEYWNDDSNTYERGYFYRPNMDFTILRITNDDIIYDELELKFVEY